MFNYDDPHLPEGLRHGMKLYLERGIPPGDFLSAVIENDLKEACARADSTNRNRLFDIVYWLYNEAPIPAWGQEGAIQEWRGFLKGEEAAS